MTIAPMIPLASLLIRSALILLTADLLRRGLRSAPAARRHAILLVGLALLIGWPLLAAMLPAISVSWPESWRAIASSWFGATGNSEGSVRITQAFRGIAASGSSPVTRFWPLIVWALGAVVTIAPFIHGVLRLRQTVRRARQLHDESMTALTEELSGKLRLTRPPRILLMEGSAMPMTFGLLTPRILLPAAALTWSLSRQRAVLLHELAHVKRRDVVWQSVSQVATSLWWFQPLSWICRGSLRRESERACDELVLRHGIPASKYAAELLEIARSFGQSPCPSAAIPMATSAGCGDLEDRLRNVLDPRHQRTGMGIFRFATALSFLALLALAASAFTLSPQPFTNQQRSSTMTIASLRKTVLSGLLASAGLSAATIGGSLLDANGAPVSGATASIYDPETAVRKEATTTPDGRFIFESLSAGSYILRIEKPGLPTLFREYKVLDNSALDRGLTIGDNTPPAESHAPDQIRLEGKVAQDKVLHKTRPTYPVSAKKAGIEGIVQLEVVLSKEGVPQDIRVLSSPSDDLSQSALEAVSQWRYETTLLNGEPVSVITDVMVHYTLLK